MDFEKFKKKFHSSWHSSVKSFIESDACNAIYKVLKETKGEVAPKSLFTFRSFKKPLKTTKVVLMFNEPFSTKSKEKIQDADGIPLSCAVTLKLHPYLNAFYNAMEKEFYGVNLKLIKEPTVDFYTSQGVMFLNDSLTTVIDTPGAHKGLWDEFIETIFIKAFSSRRIPVVFCGKELYEKYKKLVSDLDLPYFVIKQPIEQSKLGIWNTNNTFKDLNNYLKTESKHEEVFWVHQDVPF